MTERDGMGGEGGGGLAPTLQRRRRAQVIGAALAILALLWALLLRQESAMTTAQRSVGWLMVAGLALYLLMQWRGRR